MNDWEQLLGLEKGWDSYNADPPNRDAVDNARKVFALLESRNIPVLRIIPMGVGGVAIVMPNKSQGIKLRQLCIEVWNDGALCCWDTLFQEGERSIETGLFEEASEGSISDAIRWVEERWSAADGS